VDQQGWWGDADESRAHTRGHDVTRAKMPGVRAVCPYLKHFWQGVVERAGACMLTPQGFFGVKVVLQTQWHCLALPAAYPVPAHWQQAFGG
jgi:hypothetical protein